MRGKCQTVIVFASPQSEIACGNPFRNSSPTYTRANINPEIPAVNPVEFFAFLMFINMYSFWKAVILGGDPKLFDSTSALKFLLANEKPGY
jgi:hypothetical protein